ncbi:MAG: LysR substrate-binding domain-containing protein [Acidobacteriota bacterium]
MFMAIVESGSFTKASEKLHVAQPSVSLQIHLLEEELGELLFLRMRNRTIQLTEAGKMLKERADLILRQFQIARMEISAISREPTGQIRIGIGGHQLTSMLPPALRDFRLRYPRIHVKLVNGTTPHIVELLKTNNLDLGVVTFPLSTDELRLESLFSEDMVVVVKKPHPLTRKQTISPAELASLPLILYDESTRTRTKMDQFFRDAKIAPQAVLELSSVQSMLMMAEAGLGATIIPASAMLGARERGGLHTLRISGRRLTREVGIAMPKVSPLPRVVEDMLRMVSQRFREIRSQLL